jgi:hypothetical protein
MLHFASGNCRGAHAKPHLTPPLSSPLHGERLADGDPSAAAGINADFVARATLRAARRAAATLACGGSASGPGRAARCAAGATRRAGCAATPGARGPGDNAAAACVPATQRRAARRQGAERQKNKGGRNVAAHGRLRMQRGDQSLPPQILGLREPASDFRWSRRRRLTDLSRQPVRLRSRCGVGSFSRPTKLTRL